MNASLEDLLIQSIPWIQDIREIVTGPLHVVGGAVRDLILKRNIHDIDFVVPKNALNISRRVANQLGGAYYPLDTERKTGRVIWMDSAGKKWHLDFAVYRGPDLDSDLVRRDFTINALAIDLHQPDKIYDPLGGAIDLQRKELKRCSPTSLQEDPVRILRAVRFASAYQLKIERETAKDMYRLVGQLSAASVERLRDEFFGILDTPQPVTCMRVLERIGTLRVMFPELVPMQGLAQSHPHSLDAWQHTLEVVSRLSQVLSVLTEPYLEESASNLYAGLISLRIGRYRHQIHELMHSELSEGRSLRSMLFFAALFHDAGKPHTVHADVSGRFRFFDHDKIGGEIITTRAKAMHLSSVEVEHLSTIVRQHMRPILLSNEGSLPTRKAIYRFFRTTGETGVSICLFSLADLWGTYGAGLPQNVWQNHLEVVRCLLSAWWDNPQESVSPPALISGTELMSELGIQPGPLVGKLLEEIREAQASGLVENLSQALDLARALLPPHE